MLTESIDSTVLPLLFSSPSTATMAFLNSVDIVSLYPSLIVNNIVLSGFNTIDGTPASLTNRGLTITVTMQDRHLKCAADTCVSVMRRWDDTHSNISKFRWNVGRRSSVWDTYMRHTSYHWQRGVDSDTKSCKCNKVVGG